MIVRLRATDIYNTLITLPAITGLVKVFSENPDDALIPSTAYIYPSYTNDATVIDSNKGSLLKQLTVQFNIVASDDPATNASDEIDDIIDAINNAIVSEGCPKIVDWNWKKVTNIEEASPSVIGFGIRNRAIRTKTYLFTYYAK